MSNHHFVPQFFCQLLSPCAVSQSYRYRLLGFFLAYHVFVQLRNDLADPFDLSLPAISKHIGVLEASGLVASRKIGRVRTCSLDRKRLASIQNWFEAQHRIWEGQPERIANHVETRTTEGKSK